MHTASTGNMKQALITEAATMWVEGAVTLLVQMTATAQWDAYNGVPTAKACSALAEDFAQQLATFVPLRDWRALAAGVRSVFAKHIEAVQMTAHDSERVVLFMECAPVLLEEALEGRGPLFDAAEAAQAPALDASEDEDAPF